MACYSWAAFDGPCADSTAACGANADCAELENCINASWVEDWSVTSDGCLGDATMEAEILYWAYVRCIYCDACNIACAADSGSKGCDKYIAP